MIVLAHVGGMPVEELLPSLACGATGLVVAARVTLRRLLGRRRASRRAPRATA
ncbi:MAG TPA: hypothetical protein VK506_13160 [Conexibacter sp.]|nr:hypothetical protein [Conexibacter sp.]